MCILGKSFGCLMLVVFCLNSCCIELLDWYHFGERDFFNIYIGGKSWDNTIFMGYGLVFGLHECGYSSSPTVRVTIWTINSGLIFNQLKHERGLLGLLSRIFDQGGMIFIGRRRVRSLRYNMAGTETDRSRRLRSVTCDTRKMLHRELKKSEKS